MHSHILTIQGRLGVFGALALATWAACQSGQSELAAARQSVVYDADDRQDVYAHSDAIWAARAVEVSAALVHASALAVQPDGSVQLTAETLANAFGVCPDERFVDQITPAFCSGTLIAPDLVLTAGQCVADQAACDDTRLVFGFHMLDATTLAPLDETNDVYTCASVLARSQNSSLDYALIRLDRAVLGRTPASVRRVPVALADDTALHVSGHPSGLPLKLDSNARVRDGRVPALDYFVTEADVFAGSAGSGVFDQATGELVGVMARGDTDYVLDGACARPNECAGDTCTGEDATYAFRALDSLCGDGLCQVEIGEASATCPDDCGGPVCGDGACNGGEGPAGCAEDCGTCGNGVCDEGAGENAATCDADCEATCGDGVCTGSEGANDCAEDCGTCGDGTCDAGESPDTCCRDCGCAAPSLERCVIDSCQPRGDVCGDPGVIEVNDDVQTVSGVTYGSNALYAGSCAPGESPERIYSFTLSGMTRVDASVSGFDTVLYLRRTCNDSAPANELACNDESDPPGDNGSRVVAELAAGTYYLIVDGYDGDSGAYQLSVSFELLCSDLDGDLECDESDGCPEDPDKVVGGDCGCGVPETDTDGDGSADCVDQCPSDPDKSLAGECGCGVPEGECSGCSCAVGHGRTSLDGGAGLLLVLVLLGLGGWRSLGRRRGSRAVAGTLVSLVLIPWLAAGCGEGPSTDGPITCADITCAEHATCDDSTGTPLCTCDPGYEGDRQHCLDVDECATGTHECSGEEMCVNIDGGFTCALPETCAEIRALAGTATDGEYTLYIGGQAAQPWTALCFDMQGTPREYLPLATSGEAQNFSEYVTTPDGRYGKDVRTTYTHVRIDPVSLTVDVSDATFASSTGSTVVDGVSVDAVPFGVAMSCDRNRVAYANIDLTGVPFVLTSGLCQGGIAASGEPSGVPAGSAVDIWASGACGWTRPDDACAANPLSGSAGQLALMHTTYSKRVFVTADAYPSALGGAAGADAICQSLADGAGLSGTFKAWLGSSEGHPAERFVRHQVPYLLPDGTTVARNWSDLTDGHLSHAIDRDQNGDPVVGKATVSGCTGVSESAVFSGTSVAGQDLIADYSCQDWSGTGTRFGVGSFDRTEGGWSDACRVQAPEGQDVCQAQSAHLYCFEQ